MRHIVTPALLLALIPTHAQNTVLEWTDPVPCGMMGEGFVSPRVQLNGSANPVVMWGRSTPAANFVAVGNGTAFAPAVMIHPPTLSPTALSWTGGDLAANGDTLWAVMKVSPATTNPCYAVPSFDGGSTWGDTVRVDPLGDGLTSEFPSIAIVPGQGPIVQYMQTDPGFHNPRYVTLNMVDGAFQSPVQVSVPYAPGEVCDCCPGQVLANSNTTVALYRNAGSNMRVIWGSASLDGGASYMAGGQLDATNWTVSSCPSSGPDGYLSEDSVRYVWLSRPDGLARIYAGSAHLPELTPGPIRQVASIPSGVQNFPKIDGNGDTLGVVWAYSSSGVTGVLLSTSTNGLGGLSVPDTVAWGGSGVNQTPDIAYHDGTFHIVWTDAASQVIRYRTATLRQATNIATNNMLNGVNVWPIPARDHVRISGTFRGPLTFELIDLSGKTVSTGLVRDERISVQEFGPATYLLRVTDGVGFHTQHIIVE